MGELTDLALDVLRTVTYVGYVLLAGILVFWLLVWPGGEPRPSAHRPRGRRHRADDRRRRSPTRSSGSRSATSRSATSSTPTTGTALMVRLAALSAAAFFLPDLVRDRIVGWRQGFAFVVVIVLAASLVGRARPDPGRPVGDASEAVASSGHVLAAAAWLGGLVALAALLVRRDEVHRSTSWCRSSRGSPPSARRCSLVTGAVQALAVAGGLGRW